MDRLKYLCNYSHDLISSTGTIPHIPPRLPKLSKTEKPCMPRKLNRREILSKKKKKKEKGKKKPSSPSLTPLYFFKRDQLLHFFLRSQSTPARARINLSTLPPPLLFTPPLLSVYRTRSIHTSSYEFSIEIYQCGDGSHRPRHGSRVFAL